ncbi:CLUMA_CG006160, isoform A [Clunio marinus]|uniref:CLUMA_CG006160, isoform A n=1 Tax=Clunio marinus TaxID=568069 RepID=A0A1J1HWW6_9DIPT|nr:CLUMA_CG006160, isoform A [Clunio marinus]
MVESQTFISNWAPKEKQAASGEQRVKVKTKVEGRFVDDLELDENFAMQLNKQLSMCYLSKAKEKKNQSIAETLFSLVMFQ